MGTFAGGLAAAGALAHVLGREPRDRDALGLFVLGAATFKGARTIARDEVTSFLREPFVEGRARDGGEEPVHTGDMRQAVGELVTCSRCVGTWVAAGLASAQVLAPRFGRLPTWTLAAGALNDWLQAGFEALRHGSNLLERAEGAAETPGEEARRRNGGGARAGDQAHRPDGTSSPADARASGRAGVRAGAAAGPRP